MGITHHLLNLFFPPHCTSCQKEGDFLCAGCLGKIRFKSLKKNPRKQVERADFEYLNGVIYAVDYKENPELQSAISQFKYRFTRELTSTFSQLMHRRLSQLEMVKNRSIALIPVPLHKKRLNYRGFNQSDLLANGLRARFRGDAEINPLLVRSKNTSQQAKLSRQERLDNLKDAFQIMGDTESLKDKICFLVDDVCTTGSTLEECARVLKQKGVKKVYGLVVARANKN